MQTATEPCIVLKMTEQEVNTREDPVVREFPLTILFNNQELVTLLCTPTNLKQLAVGFLFSEGLLRAKNEITNILVDEQRGIVSVEAKVTETFSQQMMFKRFITSGCGRGTSFYNAADIRGREKIGSQLHISASQVFALAHEFLHHSQIYKLTGGVHSAALCDATRILIFAEDIGRHNALDKIFGQCLLEEIPVDDHFIVSTGRISSEMLLKVAKRQIPIVISKSAPTSLSVKLAAEFGMTLVGFVRGKRMNVYTHAWRIINNVSLSKGNVRDVTNPLLGIVQRRNEMKSVYLDNAASTPVDERVVAAMLPFFAERFGNPSSLHSKGQETRQAVDQARAEIAGMIGARHEEVIFTSSGTESNNFALKGCAFANRQRGNHIVVSAIEHDCVLNSCKWLQTQGFDVTYLPVDAEGLIDLNRLQDSLRPETILVSIMHANNEIGVIEPLEEIGNLCRARGIYFHTDACQSFGKIPFDVQKLQVDLATINGHKIYGPKGIGALYIRTGVKILPWQHGGGHEFGLRSATENVPGIVGFATAARLCLEEMETELPRLQALRDRILETIFNTIPSAYLNGHRHLRLPTNMNVGFEGFEGQSPNLLMALDTKGIIVSTGSACSSNQNKTSHVLAAIGRNPLQAIGALRITLGRFTTAEDIDYFLNILPETVNNLHSLWSR
jgi:cysteine desulfurase